MFCCKKSSALLVQGQQSSLKGCLSSRHSTTCGDCNRKIYENTGSVQNVSMLKDGISNVYIYIIHIYICSHKQVRFIKNDDSDTQKQVKV